MTPKKNYELHDGKKGAALAIRVTPRATKNEITEIMSDGTVKIRLKAPMVEGEANDALLEYLSGVLDVPVAKLDIVAGLVGHDKLVSVIDLDAQSVHKKILENLS
ncbi:MAG: DUF167 domain-containing protein [Chloroflexota bacterium]